ncbi:hypothetical protein [Mycolicibacterium duvalii]|nr:hypothetical protein [Mycolicibacterium duvalii]
MRAPRPNVDQAARDALEDVGLPEEIYVAPDELAAAHVDESTAS